MNEFHTDPPGVTQSEESTPILLQQLAMKFGNVDKKARDYVFACKECGEILLKLKRHGENLKPHLEKLGIGRRASQNYMDLAANWKEVGHPATIREALDLIHKKQPEEPKPPPAPTAPAANPPLCKACQRNVRCGQAPTAKCPDCKTLRAKWQAEQDAREPGVEDEETDPTAGLTETSGPSGPRKPRPPKSGEEVLTVRELLKPCHILLRRIDDYARQHGRVIDRGAGQVASVRETPEIKGLHRLVAETLKNLQKWAKSLEKQ